MVDDTIVHERKWRSSAAFNEHTISLKLVALITFSAIFFGALTYAIMLAPNAPGYEYGPHIHIAMQMDQESRIVVPHFLFHILTIIHYHFIEVLSPPTHQITSNGWTINYAWGVAALVVMIEVYVGIVVLLFYHIRHRLHNNERISDNISFAVAFGISICCPLFILAPIDGSHYYGYITPSTIYITPTQALLKLPSLALFLVSLPCFFSFDNNKTRKQIYKHVIFFFLLAIISGLAKPSFLIVYVPAVVIAALYCIYKKYYVDLRVAIFTLTACIAVLIWQYYFKFIDPTTPTYKSALILTPPFEVWGHYSNFLLPKIVLSVFFPLYVLFFFFKDVSKDIYTKFAWLLFLIGTFYLGFVAESGPAKYAANFAWSAQIACFMLFVSSASLFFTKCTHRYGGNKMMVTGGIVAFSAHVTCGLYFYAQSFWKFMP